MKNKILNYLFVVIPKKQILSFIFGINYISENMIGYEKGEKIKINKEYPSFVIISGFYFRILLFSCLIYWFNNAYIRKLVMKLLEILFQDTELLETTLIIVVVLELYLFGKYLSKILKKRLHEVGFDKRKDQQLPQYFTVLKLFEIIIFIPIFLSAMELKGMWILYFFFLIFILIYLNIAQEKIEKKNIISFYSKIDYDDASDSVDIENDIIIMLNTMEAIQVNLLNTNIYIQNNDDILLLFKNHESDTIKRSNILYIKVKDFQLRYVNNQWINGKVIHYSM